MRMLSDQPGGPDSVIDVLDTSQRAVRRRQRLQWSVAGGVVALCLLAGQVWNYARPDEYRTSLRLQLAWPGLAAAASAPANGLAELALALHSRPLLDRLARAMASTGQPLAADADQAVVQLQAMLQVQTLVGGELLLQATGAPPARLAAVLNAWPELIRAELQDRQARDADARLSEAWRALAQVAQAADARRTELARAGLPAARDDGDVAARHAGPTVVLHDALAAVAAAQARLQALRDHTDADRDGALVHEDPALAALEVRAALAREELRDLAHGHSAEFLATDPPARALRSQLDDLERRIARQRGAGPSSAVAEAKAALAAAQAEVARLRARPAVAPPARLAAGPAQARDLADDLARLEATRRELLARVDRLSAERRRPPAVTVLSPAAVPTRPFRPDHRRDALWVLGGALLAGLLALGLGALFMRPSRAAPG